VDRTHLLSDSSLSELNDASDTDDYSEEVYNDIEEVQDRIKVSPNDIEEFDYEIPSSSSDEVPVTRRYNTSTKHGNPAVTMAKKLLATDDDLEPNMGGAVFVCPVPSCGKESGHTCPSSEFCEHTV
jgi:hypothetical protein